MFKAITIQIYLAKSDSTVKHNEFYVTLPDKTNQDKSYAIMLINLNQIMSD